jgi:site-specific recombinase XerD
MAARELRRIGVEATLHQCRHWFATNLVRGGVNVRKV